MFKGYRAWGSRFKGDRAWGPRFELGFAGCQNLEGQGMPRGSLSRLNMGITG